MQRNIRHRVAVTLLGWRKGGGKVGASIKQHWPGGAQGLVDCCAAHICPFWVLLRGFGPFF